MLGKCTLCLIYGVICFWAEFHNHTVLSGNMFFLNIIFAILPLFDSVKINGKHRETEGYDVQQKSSARI